MLKDRQTFISETFIIEICRYNYKLEEKLNRFQSDQIASLNFSMKIQGKEKKAVEIGAILKKKMQAEYCYIKDILKDVKNLDSVQ